LRVSHVSKIDNGVAARHHYRYNNPSSTVFTGVTSSFPVTVSMLGVIGISVLVKFISSVGTAVGAFSCLISLILSEMKCPKSAMSMLVHGFRGALVSAIAHALVGDSPVRLMVLGDSFAYCNRSKGVPTATEISSEAANISLIILSTSLACSDSYILSLLLLPSHASYVA